MKLNVFISVLSVMSLCTPALSADSSRPNVILIVTDDQGYGDLSAHGNPVLKTPNMDFLAKHSVRFTDFHVAPMCSPTRGQLMTGIDAMKNGCTAVSQGRSMIRRELPTMANFFAESGYTTGHFGKWHLGDSYPHRPQDRGFQETLHHRAWGITSLADYWGNTYFAPVLEHNGTDKKYEGYCTDIFFDEAMKWMQTQSSEDKPFFCYLPTNTPHVPEICAEQYSQAYEGKHEGKPMPAKFYGMIANLDENLGKLEAFLNENKLRDNTLLIYMSDNGTQSQKAAQIDNAGMRAQKTSVYEGGHRVPLFVRWPNGKLKHDSNIDKLTQVQDLLPTMVELCGLSEPNALASGPRTKTAANSTPAASAVGSRHAFDGTSLAGLLKGMSDSLPDRKLVIQYRVSGDPWDPAVVLWDKWRLLKENKGKKAANNKKPPELYHVGRDPGQTQNVAEKHPEVVQAMTKHYETWHAEARQLFDLERWITVGSKQANPVTLYSQDWVGDYCDNPKGLSLSNSRGYWNVIVDREGEYEVELRRWPKESQKTLTEGWQGPQDKGTSARPIAAAQLQVAGESLTLDTNSNDTHATFRVRLPAGKTQLATTLLDADKHALCSAIYVNVRRINEADVSKVNLSEPSTLAVDKKGDRSSIHDQPNIVLIFIDDMGYGDIGPFGNKVNKTPNLDRMAREGNVLRQFYVANTACTPSRAALLTGTYAARIGMDGDVLFPGQNRGLNPEEVTIADMLKANNYATGCFSKWHLGDQPEFMPLAQGFDEYFGIPYSNDMWPGNRKGHRYTKRPYTPLPIMHQNKVVSYVSDGADQSLLCEATTDYTLSFIEDHKDQPFFCYVPHAYVHLPRYARPEILAEAGGDVNRSNVEEVDISVGRILDKLRELKIDEKTLVIFTSDNGGARGMSMGPLRGGKGGPKYEGHMREPTITWWPGTIPAGVESNGIAVTTDILPTLARLTDANAPNDRTLDGKDVLDILLGKADAKSPHDVHYYEVEGIRRGDWKLVRNGNKDELYNLDQDLGEKKNLAKQHPQIVTELVALLQKHAASIEADLRPAGFINSETAKPLIAKPGDLPKLRDFMGLPKTTATGEDGKKAVSEPTTKDDFKAKLGSSSQQAPNFVVILADDQGWNSLSMRMDPNDPGSGSTYYQTPHLDKLASEGMRFSQAYSPAPTCSPTRHAIQFGRSPSSLKIFIADHIDNWDADSSESLSNVLKRVNEDYVCAHLGKWHIGRSPQELGFDVHDDKTQNKEGNSKNADDPKLIFDLSRRSIEFMDDQVAADKPFFLQVSHYANHLDFQAKSDTIANYETQHADNATIPFSFSSIPNLLHRMT